MRFSASWLLLAFALATAARPSKQGCKVKESIDDPRGWVKQLEAPADYVIELRIALPQPNFSVLESHLYEVSDPYHERYGAHLSKEEVEALVAPHDESIDLVNDWLASHGIQTSDISRSPAKDWAYVKVPVSKAEEMLDTKYHIWQHVESGDAAVRTTSYGLPEHLHEHVDLIQPTTLFSRFKGMKSTLRIDKTSSVQAASIADTVGTITSASGAKVDASCNKTITVTCLKQLYNAVGYKPVAIKENQVAVTGYLEQYANFDDYKLFTADQVPAAVNTTFKVVSVKDGLNNQTADAAGVEANLDVQFAFGISYPTPSTFYTTAGRPPFNPDSNAGETNNTNEPYVDWLDYVLAHPNPPSTISTSYDDDEQTVPLSYAIRSCNSFAQLGARGVSLTFSSGDGGVGDGNPDPATTTCKNAKNETIFTPLFPSSCPFVTSVGGTVHVPETAVFFSGGGFSNYFSRPPYQDEAVEGYLKKLPKGLYKGLYNPAGRGIPDVSAQGDYFRVFYEGAPISVGGTSASSPTFAGFIALLNDYRKSKGLPALGFLNPWLYSKGYKGLNDITVGNNPGCGTEGFNATIGWDPISGLGTPNFKELQKLVV